MIAQARAVLSRWLQRTQARFVRVESLILRESRGKIDPGSRPDLCVFSHYDPEAVVADYVVYYVQELERAGFEVIFVTTAETIADSELNKVRPFCSRILVRRNLTLDFGSWKAGLSRQNLNGYSRLILCNDSCYGPVSDFTAFLDRMRPDQADVWGMTESFESRWHLQSYFLLFHANALRHPAFLDFWRSFRFVRSKYRVVQDYELGLSSQLREGGLRLAAVIPYLELETLAKSRDFQYRDRLSQGPLNPTLFMWDLLVSKYGAPLVKTELFKQNRFESRAIRQWKSILSGRYDLSLIERHRPAAITNAK